MKKEFKPAVGLINMAFGAGSESKESAGFTKYVGIAPFFVEGINLTTAEIKSLYPERNIEKEQEYGYNKEGEAKGTFVTFFLKANSNHKDLNGVELSTRAAYLVKDEIKKTQAGKYQFINKYGDTVYMTKEEFDAKQLPENAAKHGFILDDLRPALVGEAELVEFLRAYINIPGSRNYNQETKLWYAKTGADLDAAVCGFTLAEIKAIANGDMKLVKQAIKIQPNNQVKLLCGVRTADGNKEYQEVCTRIPIKLATTKYDNVKKSLENLKSNGSYANSNFGEFPFTFAAYSPTMTSFSQGSSSAPAAGFDFSDF